MLEQLKLRGVGPAPELEISFRERINFLVGDNGLGKTFLLDVAWWALTRTWARQRVLPHPPPAVATIAYKYETRTRRTSSYTSTFDRETERWSIKASRPAIPGLVLYAQADGGFSVWDPARNYWKKASPGRPNSYLFKAKDVWEGTSYCEGLIRDWASWQREGGEAFSQLEKVLLKLSPSTSERMEPGALRRISLDDPRKHPTIKMPYEQHVPLVHASAGMRRIVALAYLLVWTWQEHLEAVKFRGDTPTKEIIFLIDEVEAHLHPQWQRRIVPALLEVMDALTDTHSAKIQLIAATHSPLVLASVEPFFAPTFAPAQDGLFLLDLKDRHVVLESLPWSKQGDVVGWLVSEAFGLHQGRSIDAEQAIEAAEAWMRNDRVDLPDELNTKKKIDDELKKVLAGHDPFWPRWVVWAENHRAEEL